MSVSRELPISHFAIGIYDGPHATPPESDDGPIFLGIKNITDDGRLDFSEIKHISYEDYPRWIKRVTPSPGDIVLSYEATLHRYAVIPEGFVGCLGRRIALIRPDTAKVESKYLLYYLLSPLWRRTVESFVINGATVDRVPIEKLPNFPVKLHSLPVQRRIVAAITAYDDLIENNLKRIALLEESARLLYREWFVQLRFPGYEHTRIMDGAPEGWEQMPFEEALVLQRGFDLPVQDRQEGDVPIYGSMGITGYHNKAMASGPGVITGRSGTLGVVHYSAEDYWPLNTALWVREFKRVGPIYAFFLLQNLNLQQFNGGVSVPSLDRKAVHRLLIVVPSSRLAGLFDEYVSPMFAMLQRLISQNEKLKQARDLLLPRLMNGEIEV